MSHPTMKCETCRWWDNSASLRDHEDSGQCRVLPPRTNKRTGTAMWPFTEHNDWCGKWRATRLPDEVQP